MDRLISSEMIIVECTVIFKKSQMFVYALKMGEGFLRRLSSILSPTQIISFIPSS